MAPRASGNQLVFLTTAEVEHLLGPKPYVGQGPTEEAISTVDLPILEGSRFRGAPIIFLGVNEPQANDYSRAIPPEQFAKALVGTPFFSIDVSDIPHAELDRLVQSSAVALDGFTLSFAEPRSAIRGMDDLHAGIFAVARSMVDWNFRNKVCGVRHPLRGVPQLIRHFYSVLCFLWLTRIFSLGRMEAVMYKPPIVVR